MNISRRDKRNRKLHNGEIQLADGRYRYKYVDELGQSRYVYSKRLVPNDPNILICLVYMLPRIVYIVKIYETISPVEITGHCGQQHTLDSHHLL